MLDRLLQRAGAHRGLRVQLWNGEERDLPAVEAIAEEFVEDIRDRTVMISEVTRQLPEMGLSRGQIHSEVASGLPGRWRVASPGAAIHEGLCNAGLRCLPRGPRRLHHRQRDRLTQRARLSSSRGRRRVTRG